MKPRALRIVLPGGSGQVGTILARHFHSRGHGVVVLARRVTPAPWKVVPWDAVTTGRWCDELENADVVINLAGRSVNCRYTAAKSSRDQRLANAFDENHRRSHPSGTQHPPSVWMNASTATIYRHEFDCPMDELTGEIGGHEPNAPDTWRFSIDVATELGGTHSSRRLRPQRVRSLLRSAMIMSPDRGGVFDTLLRLVRFGMGGASGSGRQFVSWIHDRDFLASIDYLLVHDDLDGAINLASPNPLPNAEFMAALRKAWGTRIGLPATEWMLEVGAIFLRTETELILKSRRVVPRRMLVHGFKFEFPEWLAAAQNLVQRWRKASDAEV